MEAWIRFCKGYVRCKLTGCSQERFLNLCRVNQIPLYHVTSHPHGYVLEVAVKDFFKLKKLLKKSDTRVKIQAKYGLPFLLVKYDKRKWFAGSLLLGAVILLFASRLLWSVELNGTVSHTQDEFIQYLKEADIQKGMVLNDICCEQLEKQIRSDFPDLVWVSVTKNGTVLKIHVEEEKKTEQDAGSEDCSDLVAHSDGTVISIVTRKGTPLVKAGDRVQKNSILVSGCNLLYDDFGNEIGTDFVRADADVVIETKLPYIENMPRSYENTIKTGKEKTCFSILTGKKILKIGKIPDHFNQCIMEGHQITINEGHLFEIPIRIVIEKYHEIMKEMALYTESEGAQIAQDRFRLYCKKMGKKGFQLVDKNVKIKVNDNNILAVGDVTFQYTANSLLPVRIPDENEEEGTVQVWD